MSKGRNKHIVWTWEAAGGVFGLVAGLLSAVLGGAVTASTWVLGAEPHPWLSRCGTALMVSTIPLLLFAGYCLDRMERGPEKTAAGKPLEKSDRDLPHLAAVVLLFSLLAAVPAGARAQQTIFNVPSGDVLDRGKVYGELDATFKPNRDAGNVVGRFSSFVPRVVVGVGGRVEVGLNVTGNVWPGDDVTTFVPAVKWKAYDGGGNGYSVVVGDNVLLPARNRELVTYGVGNYLYAQVSKTFKGANNARLTAGGYHFSRGVVAPEAQRAGGQFGFEQPVGPRFGVAADWYTGKHAAGYFTPGVNFKPHPRVTGYVGYSIGNSNVSNGNHFFYAAAGVNFN